MTSETLLLRQVNPAFIHDGQVSSQAFRPTTKDSSLLSVYDSDLISPAASWKHYTEKLGLSSIGALAVSVDNCKALNLTARPDPQQFPEHAVIDFSGCSRSQTASKAKSLKQVAESRGWQFQFDLEPQPSSVA